MSDKKKISDNIAELFGGNTTHQSNASKEKKAKGDNQNGLGHGGPSRINNRYPTSIIIDKEKYNKIKIIAITNFLNINEVVDVAFEFFLDEYEKKNGAITPRESNISAKEIILSRKSNSRKG